MLDEVVPAFERLRAQGKFRFFGITAVGETAALHRVVDARVFDTAQVSYNLLNPSPGGAVPAGFPAQDYGNLLGHTQAADMGVIMIRVLAGGALSGTEERHPNWARRRRRRSAPAPATTAIVERARRFEPLVREGHADSLIEARCATSISHRAVSTVLVGYLDAGAARITPRARSKRARCRQPRSPASRKSSRALPASRASQK